MKSFRHTLNAVLAGALLLGIQASFTVHADAVDSFRRTRDGVPAALTGDAFYAARDKARVASERFAVDFQTQVRPGPKGCERFNALAVRAARDVAKTLRSFTGVETNVNMAAAVLAHARLQIELPMFAQLATFIAEDREGGYGFLDQRQKKQCAYGDRAAAKAAFTALSEAYLDLQDGLIGRPGITSLEQLTERLLTLALREETHTQRVDLLINAVLFIGSYYAYRLATPVVSGWWGRYGLQLPGRVGAIARSRPMSATLSAAVFIGDGVVTGGVASWINPAEAQRHKEAYNPQFDFGSWAERIADMEKLLNARLEEPQLYLSYVSTLESDLSIKLVRELTQNQGELAIAAERDPEVARELQEATWLSGEAQFLRGQNPGVAARQLPEFILGRFKTQVSCASGQFPGASPIQCLIGTRRVARALYSGALKIPTDESGELAMLNVGTFKAYGIKTLETAVRFDMPYKRPSAQMAQFAKEAFVSREMKAKIKLKKQFAVSLDRWQKSGTLPVDFDPDLTLEARWNALNVLTMISQREPALLKRATDGLYLTKPIIGSGYRTAFEHHQRLQESFPAAASYDLVVQFLRQAQDPKVVEPVRREMDDLRARIAQVQASIKTKWSIEARCSDAGGLRLVRCLNTLKRLDGFATRYPQTRPEAEVLLVTGAGEIGDGFEKVQSPEDPNLSIWAIRDTFQVNSLYDFLKGTGWLLEE